jgi:predicted DNA-binding transcriptional regulator AlpA
MAGDGKNGTGAAQPSSGEGCSRLLSERDLAERWGISEITLQDWRCRGKGPPFVRLGRMIRYRAMDIEMWVLAHEVQPSRTVGASAALESRGGSDGGLAGADLRAARGAS